MVSYKTESQTKVGADEVLVCLDPEGEPTFNRQDNLAAFHRRHLQVTLEVMIPRWANVRNFGLLLLFEMLPDGYTSACCSGNPYPPKLNIIRLCYS